MSRYKVLSLPLVFTLNNDEWEEWGVSAMYKGIPINPIFNRHGWYYDRETRSSWIECNHGCWRESSPEMFLYTLENENHVMLPNKVVQAIKVLINYGMCPKELISSLRKEDEIRGLIDIRRGYNRR